MRGIAFALCWALGVGAAAAAPSRPPTILQVYPAAETTTSASVVWNTDTASDSLLQYSMENPIPTDAPRIYLAASVTYHEIALSGLTPGALYH
ncbi:MAG TPA: hypothetical protein VFO11_13770, partial [Candidatus Polarisedimenticolaceae bacterium]|nr:hypothetical protein [Candidatus Polarisedimenticolaceae bacterium]